MANDAYNKLVRDRVPEILRNEGVAPRCFIIPEADRLYHLHLKLLEESHSLFRSVDQTEFVKGAANLLEVLHSLALEHGTNWKTIETERTTRVRELGGYSQGIFVQSDQKGEARQRSIDETMATPCLLTRRSSPSLLDVIQRELDGSCNCCIAVAFCSRGMLNQLMRPFERFLERDGEVQILTSVMNNFNNPDDLVHLQRELPGCEIFKQNLPRRGVELQR